MTKLAQLTKENKDLNFLLNALKKQLGEQQEELRKLYKEAKSLCYLELERDVWKATAENLVVLRLQQEIDCRIKALKEGREVE